MSKNLNLFSSRSVRIHFIMLALLASVALSAQLSTIHYLPPLYGSSADVIGDHSILITNPNNVPATVSIQDGAGNSVEDGLDQAIPNRVIPPNSTTRMWLGNSRDAANILDRNQLNTVISSEENLIIRSDEPVYVQVRHLWDLHGLMYSSKGDWALGNRFRAGTAFSRNGFTLFVGSQRADFISIMAVNDNTTVEFSEFKPSINLIDGGGATDFSITLNENNSYTIASVPTANDNMLLTGTLIRSDGPIIVNCGSWLIDNSDLFTIGERDMGADQIIPMNRLDTEYVLMNVDGSDFAEKIMVVADQDGTQYFLNGSGTPSGTLNAGQFDIIDKDEFSINNNMHLESNVPVVVYQTTGLEDFSSGFNIITPLKCWGTRSTVLPGIGENFDLDLSRINIVARRNTNINITGGTLENPRPVPGTSEFETYRVTPTTRDDIFITANRNIQIGTSYRRQFLGAATYYSEYAQRDTSLFAQLCPGSSVTVGNSVYTETGIYMDTLSDINQCDSIITLDLLIFDVDTIDLVENICPGDSILFEGTFYSQEGVYTENLISVNSCDSVRTLQLSFLDAPSDTIFTTACQGELYNGIELNADTFFIEQFTSIQSCDSIVTTFISVFPEYEMFLQDSICFGESIQIGNQMVNESGQYFDTLTTFQGCDSIMIIDLVIREEALDTNNISLCQGELYNGIPIQVDTSIIEISQDINNCQLTTTTLITINDVIETSQNLNLCPGQTYNGILVNNDTTIVENLNTISGCDSIATSIVVIDTFESLDTIFLNQGETYNGIVFEMDSLINQNLSTIDGCDSLAMTQIIINPIITTEQFVDLCPGESFDNTIYFADSTYVLSLTAANGFDSLVTFIIDVHETFADTIQQNICSGDSIMFAGVFQSEAGFYSDPSTSIFGCDSILVLNLNVEDQITSDDQQSICEGDSLFLAGAFQTTSGIYQDVLIAASGCDSVVNTNLVVNTIIENAIDIPLCANETYNGISITQDSTIIEAYTSASGCDSLLSVNLILNPTYDLLDTTFVMEGQGFENDTLITEVLLTANGCDSIQNTQIIILPSISVVIDDAVCQGESYNGVQINQDTTILDTLTAINGVDSFMIFQITAHPLFMDTLEIQICEGDSILFGTTYQSDQGIYTDTQSSIFGCDSISVLELTVLDMIENTETAMICSGDSLFVGGAFQNTNGTYVDVLQTATGCDSMVNTILTVVESITSEQETNICQGETYEGVLLMQDSSFVEAFTSMAGCDSIIMTNVFVNPTYDLLDTTFVFEGQGFEMDTLITEVLFTANGCDSIQNTQIIILPSVSTTIMETLCEGEFLNGVQINQDTIIIDTLMSSTGVDSFVITEVTAYPASNSIQTIELCEGDVFMGESIIADTTISTLLLNANDCDSLVSTEILVAPTYDFLTTVLLNEGESYEGMTYESDTLLTQNLLSSEGCDSILNVQILILDDIFNTELVELCEGQAYEDVFYVSDTILLDTLTAVSGADSINLIEIDIIDTVWIFETFQACEGDTLFFGSIPITEDEIISEQILNDEGCFDEIFSVFEFGESISETERIEICTGQTFVFNGEELFESGIYSDTLISNSGCDSIYIVDLTVSEESSIDIEGLMPYCEDDFLELTVGSFDTYAWSDGSSASNLIVNEAGTYSLTVTDSEGCIFVGTIDVFDPIRIEADLVVNSPGCSEENFGSLEITSPLGTNEDLSFTLLNESDELVENFEALLPGFYNLEIVDDNGCSKFESFQIEEPFDLEVSIQGEDLILLGDSTLLFADTNTDSLSLIQWTPSEGLSCDECLNPFASPTSNTTYTLLVSTAEGCIDSTTFDLRVDNNVAVYIPDVFSPNGDGINDFFYIHTNPTVEMIESLIIFDRWGNQVFINQNFLPNVELEGWNGSFRAKRMNPGVYVFAAEILLKNGERIFEKGDLLLLQ